MAKKHDEPQQAAPKQASGSGLIIFLVALMMLIGMADAFLWGVLGYGYYQNTHPEAFLHSQTDSETSSSQAEQPEAQ